MKKYLTVDVRDARGRSVVVGRFVMCRSRPRAAPAAPTFNKDIAPIFYANCTSCHRPGDIAPMSLLTYKDARPWAKAIASKVADGTMPPWHADPKYGTFVGARGLSVAHKETIAKWVAAGAPEGNGRGFAAGPRLYRRVEHRHARRGVVDAGGLSDSGYRGDSVPIPGSPGELR